MRAAWRGFALAAACTILAACGGDGDTSATATKSNVDFLVDYMRDWYLWFDTLPPTVDTTFYASPDAALDALRAPLDRYSYVEAQATYDAFFDAGQALGFGVGYEAQADSLALWMVQPDSPAYAAGLRRGDRITAIDAVSVSDLIAQARVSEAFGADEPGVTARFLVRRPAGDSEIIVSKAWYPVRYVPATAYFDVAGRRIGYISLYAFASPTAAAWRTAVDSLVGLGAQDLIVDLRDNGGGLLASAATVGAALGTASLSGQTMSELVFNTRHPEAAQRIDFPADVNGGRFARLVWLTGARTCSASEALVAGLQPFRSATRIGETTCGKPVGFTPPRYGGLVYSIVSFSLVNAAGAGGYYDGLAPDCPVSDPITGALGAADEPLLAAALAFLANGRCPTAAAAGARAKAFVARPRERGLATVTGLH